MGADKGETTVAYNTTDGKWEFMSVVVEGDDGTRYTSPAFRDYKF